MAIGYDFTAPLWQWKGDTPWHFMTVPEAISDEIAARMEGFARGFGSVRVRVREDPSGYIHSPRTDRQETGQ